MKFVLIDLCISILIMALLLAIAFSLGIFPKGVSALLVGGIIGTISAVIGAIITSLLFNRE
jgi:hypothetical protein